MLKVAAVVLLFLVGAVFAIGADAWADLPQVVTRPGIPAAEIGFTVLLGALAFAGAGGGQNLVQSNWIPDKGFGMGSYVPHLVSPITGESEAAPSTGYIFTPTEQCARSPTPGGLPAAGPGGAGQAGLGGGQRFEALGWDRVAAAQAAAVDAVGDPLLRALDRRQVAAGAPPPPPPP